MSGERKICGLDTTMQISVVTLPWHVWTENSSGLCRIPICWNKVGLILGSSMCFYILTCFSCIFPNAPVERWKNVQMIGFWLKPTAQTRNFIERKQKSECHSSYLYWHKHKRFSWGSSQGASVIVKPTPEQLYATVRPPPENINYSTLFKSGFSLLWHVFVWTEMGHTSHMSHSRSQTFKLH